MNCSTTLNLNVTTTEVLTLGGVSQNFPVPLLPSLPFANGTAGSQVDEHWELIGVTLAASASVTYTLSALTDQLGRAVALAKVRLLVITVTGRTAGDYLTVGNAGTHPWVAPFGGTTPTLLVFDLAVLAATLTDGYAVAAGSADQLKVVNSGSHPITFTIAAVGTSV